MARKRRNQSSPGPSRPTKLRRSGRNAATPATAPGPSAAADTVETTSESAHIPDSGQTPNDVETPVTEASMADSHPSVLEEVDGAPPAWADDRASLACTIPWFNSTQAGMYYKDEFCWGLLINEDCGARAYVDDEVVITRLGGGSEKENGKLVVKKGQDETNLLVRCIMKSKINNQEVGLIIGSKNNLLNRKLPHHYNVMDYFQIAKVWPEKQDGQVFYKVRFEKLDISKKSWWARKGAPDPMPHEQRTMQPVEKVCPTCTTKEMQVYKQGWTCLNRHCGDFWKITGHDITNSMDLTFHDAFLEYRTPPLKRMPDAPSLVPDRLPEIAKKEVEDPHFYVSREAMRGIVCPTCRRCIPRRFWEGWKCADDGVDQGASAAVNTTNKCPFQKWLSFQPLSLEEAIGTGSAKARRDSSASSGYLQPEISDTLLAPYTIHTYEVEGAGYIVHFVANKEINERPGGPSDLFKELQETQLGLRRFPLIQAMVKGTLQAQFGVNYGLPYKFVVPSASLAFNGACDAIYRVLGRLTWATKRAVASKGHTTECPNELLVLGYGEGQKIGYHDDGEDSLGPTIASLSLGAPSTMSIRMKYKYYHGFIKKSHRLLDIDPVLPKCENYEKRLELKKDFYNLPETAGYNKLPENKEEYEKWKAERFGKEKNPKTYREWWQEYKNAWWEMYKSILEKESRGSPPDLIKMELNHGDMVVMHGEKLQQYYEHAVSVKGNGKLRFAMTARYIKRDKVDKEDWPKGDFRLTGEQIYNGG